jgi:hypothetical protein
VKAATADCRFVRRIQVDRWVAVWTAAGLVFSAVCPFLGDGTELHRLGYRPAQGYRFGRPVPPPAFRLSADVTVTA